MSKARQPQSSARRRSRAQREKDPGPSTAGRHIALHHLRQAHPALFDKLAPLATTKAYFLVTRPLDVIEAV